MGEGDWPSCGCQTAPVMVFSRLGGCLAGRGREGHGPRAVTRRLSMQPFCMATSSQVLSFQLDFKCLKAMETAGFGSDGGKGQNLSGTKESPPQSSLPKHHLSPRFHSILAPHSLGCVRGSKGPRG